MAGPRKGTIGKKRQAKIDHVQALINRGESKARIRQKALMFMKMDVDDLARAFAGESFFEDDSTGGASKKNKKSGGKKKGR